jgi:DNA-directed RNA polymerase subunit M/transcription elongation factor TFIIS
LIPLYLVDHLDQLLKIPKTVYIFLSVSCYLFICTSLTELGSLNPYVELLLKEGLILIKLIGCLSIITVIYYHDIQVVYMSFRESWISTVVNDSYMKSYYRAKKHDPEFLYNISAHIRLANDSDTLEEIKAVDDIFDLKYYTRFHDQWIKERSEWIGDAEVVEEGEFTCANRLCQSKRCYFWTEQNRSSDEAATIHVMCSVCGKKYSFNP